MGLAGQKLLANVSLWPNPTKDVLTVMVPHTSALTYQIMDSRGSLILTGDLPANPSGHAVSLPVSNLASGLYFLHIQSENGNAVKRFVKE